ncbi:MAG: hypothetical protein MUC83_18225 [Pirellula sp.]|nr:hypothetical protein [Pirellula sp.]
MNWRSELARLRETLTRSHAIEAFQHFRECLPKTDAELEAFIVWYVQYAYDENFEDWDAIPITVSRLPKEGPIGKRLSSEGYANVWNYFSVQGVDFEAFKQATSLPNLTPLGFESFVVETALSDGRWDLAFRSLTCFALNASRDSSALSAASSVGRLASSVPKEISWVRTSCEKLSRKIAKNEFDRNRLFDWQDEWLFDYIPEGVAGHNPMDRSGGSAAS